MEYIIQIYPAITNNRAIIFHNILPAGRIIGVKAIPTTLKKATTQPVHPKVSNTKNHVKKGIALIQTGSDLFKL